MNAEYLIYTVSAVFLAFSAWCFVDGFRVSKIELIGAFTYLILAILTFSKFNFSRYLSFLVLTLHIGFSLFIIVTLFKMGWSENEQLTARGAINSQTGDGVMNIDIGYARQRFLFFKSSLIALVLGFCFYVLTNTNVIELFRQKNT